MISNDSMWELHRRIHAEVDVATAPPEVPRDGARRVYCRRQERKGLFRKGDKVYECRNEAGAGEVQLKVWVDRVARVCGVKVSVIWHRYYRGGYKGLVLRRVNQRVIFVDEARSVFNFTPDNSAEPGEVSLKEWIGERARREGASERAIWMRLYRGEYEGLKFRRVNQRVVFVRVAPAAEAAGPL